MAAMRAGVVVALLAMVARADDVKLDSPEDLADQYYNIFKTGNRNAASHLWTSFILNRAGAMPAEKLNRVMRGFCAVSGSVIPDDPHTMYKTTLPRVAGGTVTGVVRHCCWPCICDMNEHVRVDTKTVTLADGPKTLDFLVIGDPCLNPDKLNQPFVDPFSGMNISLGAAASELRCEGGKLSGAIYSDHGHPIVGMFFTDAEALDAVPMLSPAQGAGPAEGDPTFGYGGMCTLRKAEGYNSGMGLIFHLVAQISPIPGVPALPLPRSADPPSAAVVQQVEAAPDVRLPPVERAPATSASGVVVGASLGALAVLASLTAIFRGRRAAKAEGPGTAVAE